MKRLFAILMSALCLTLSITAFAEFYNSPIYDDAGFLTDEEVTELTQKIETMRETYDIDIAIVTEDEMSGSDAQNTADDIFDYNGYGAGEDSDGIMLYISRNPRAYHLSTHGKGITYFTDSRLISIENAFLPYLKKNDYYSAFDRFATKCDEILNKAINYSTDTDTDGMPYETSEQGIPAYVLIIAFLSPLLIAFVAMNAKLSKMNTAIGQSSASRYVKMNSMNLTASNDIFLYSTVTQTAKPKSQDSSNSSSSTHTSSSGRTHGGRGGSY